MAWTISNLIQVNFALTKILVNQTFNHWELEKQDEAKASTEFFENALPKMIHEICNEDESYIVETKKILQGMRGHWTKLHSSILANMLQRSSANLVGKCISDILIRRFLSTHDGILLQKYNGKLVFYLSLVYFLLADTRDQQISSLIALHQVEDEGGYLTMTFVTIFYIYSQNTFREN